MSESRDGEGDTIRHCIAQADVFDKAFIGVVGTGRSSFMTPGRSLSLPLYHELKEHSLEPD